MTELELYHHGILGQKWGVRRYQNPDGTLTDAGRKKYSKIAKKAPVDFANKRTRELVGAMRSVDSVSKAKAELEIAVDRVGKANTKMRDAFFKELDNKELLRKDIDDIIGAKDSNEQTIEAMAAFELSNKKRMLLADKIAVRVSRNLEKDGVDLETLKSDTHREFEKFVDQISEETVGNFNAESLDNAKKIARGYFRYRDDNVDVVSYCRDQIDDYGSDILLPIFKDFSVKTTGSVQAFADAYDRIAGAEGYGYYAYDGEV